MDKPHPENLNIRYTFECYIEGMYFDLYHEKEIQVKQFLFTEDEITKDLKI